MKVEMTTIKTGDRVRLSLKGKQNLCLSSRTTTSSEMRSFYAQHLEMFGNKIGLCTYVEIFLDVKENRVHIMWSYSHHWRLLPEHLTLVESAK
jgi:hypothetical protein